MIRIVLMEPNHITPSSARTNPCLSLKFSGSCSKPTMCNTCHDSDAGHAGA
jgi:hypothetical protein